MQSMQRSNSAAVKHTNVMTEMEDTWRTADMSRVRQITPGNRSGAGSAAQPIDVDDDDDDVSYSAAGRTGADAQQMDDASAAQSDLWGHAVREQELALGDQIYAYRGAVQHHGIVTHVPGSQGGNVAMQRVAAAAAIANAPSLSPHVVHVVHFDSRIDGVETTSLEAFLKGGTLRRATYSASTWTSSTDYGASYSCPSDDPALIVTRATEAAKFGEGASGWSGYSLLTNNCETFAFWCSTGRRQTLSRQASRGLVGAGVVAAGVSAVASAGGLTSAGVAATAMVPRGARGIHKTLKAVEWAVGMSVVAVSVADGVSSLVTRSRGGRPGQTEEAGGVCA